MRCTDFMSSYCLCKASGLCVCGYLHLIDLCVVGPGRSIDVDNVLKHVRLRELLERLLPYLFLLSDGGTLSAGLLAVIGACVHSQYTAVCAYIRWDRMTALATPAHASSCLWLDPEREV